MRLVFFLFALTAPTLEGRRLVMSVGLCKPTLARDFVLANSLAVASNVMPSLLGGRGGGVASSGLPSFVLGAGVSLLRDKGVHPLLEGLSWGVILQSALVLGIWTTASASTTKTETSVKTTATKKTKVMAMLVSFIAGTIGSLLGALLGAWPLVGHHSIGSGGNSNREVFRIAAASLSASYIGGTANFFETASLLKASAHVSKTLNMIAGIDIIVMCAYFSLLLLLRSNSNSLPAMQPGVLTSDGSGSGGSVLDVVNDADVTETRDSLSVAESLPQAISSLFLATALAFFSSVVQNRLLQTVPGVSVMCSTLGALVLGPWLTKKKILASSPRTNRMLQTHLMSLFYAIVGLGCKLTDLSSVGAPILLLILATLSVHLLFVLAGSYLWNRLVAYEQGPRASLRIDMDTAIIASNACVGGSSTAAAMASALPRGDLVIPASICGLLGYVIGTPCGQLVALCLK